jgi:pimeloyl-ACP methyl ester carboxylesterase
MRKKSALSIVVLFIFFLLTVMGCAPTDAPGPGPEETRPQDARVFTIDAASMEFSALAGASAWYGVRPNGAGYRVEVPDNWNGILVMYAHGYRGTVLNLTITNPSIRQHLIDSGYAWAASTYSKNWYDVRSGVEDTNELALAFESITGLAKPTKYYIIGHSMGGHITAAAVEAETIATAKHVVRYAAALPMCGVVGDLNKYNHGFIRAAQHLAGYPAYDFPNDPTDWTNVIFPGIKASLWVDYVANKNNLTVQGAKLKGILMNMSGGDRPVFNFSFPLFLDLLFGYGPDDGTSGGIYNKVGADTQTLVYRWESTPGAALTANEQYFNDAVYRIVAAPDANRLRRDGLRWVPLVHGNFSVPVLTLHDVGDLFVPFVMEQEYRQNAVTRGNGDRLVQRAIRSYSHCGFTLAETIAAFNALVLWETNGAIDKPAGDDVLTPATLADANYGCQFTLTTRAGIAACPAP